MSVRVLLADDHQLVRTGLRRILEAEPDLAVVGEAGDGVEAVELTRTLTPDLAVLDVSMPRMTGLQAARQIARRSPAVRMLMLSMYDDDQYFFAALQAGASGYVLKSAADEDLVAACRAAIRGESFLYAGVAGALVRDVLERVRRGERVPRTPLTEREEEVVKLIAEGHTSREIARALVISVKTVERHRANVLTKLGLHDRTQLTRYAIRAGLIEP
ncbi:response regulator [Desertihabitans brevis]|uniref:response regulator n=1 Tax=Desertihabitans brevis TaxID=2268447 RepID=UPI0018F4EC02|nr:response regulator transcription factor [Desertihabitans brevis]